MSAEFPWRVRRSHGGWVVEQELMCINGLCAWFRLATIHDSDDAELGMSEGAISSAKERLAAALSPAPEEGKK